MKKYFYFAAALAIIAMTSCSDEKDLYDPSFQKKAFETNFIKKYGTIDAEQSWDFAPNADYSLTGTSPQKAMTRAAGATITTGDYYQVEEGTLSWLKGTIVESTDNRSLGTPFIMSMPSNTFTIVPIYQGAAGMTWNLHMVVDGEDYNIWSKSQGIQTSTDGNNWNSLSLGENTASAAYVRSKQLTVDNVPVGSNIYFYLEVTQGVEHWANTGSKQSSLAGMMLALDCPRPTNISAEKEVRVIGCEDADLDRSDWDMNDIVFMVIGNPEAPKPIEIVDETITQSYDKRYMIEDLGATDDFDFNDIVVDVHAERTVKYTITNHQLTNTTYGEWSQKATVCHLGGTLPFTLKIGDTIIDDIAPQMDVDINRQYTITGWEPTENNIEVVVKDGKNNGVQEIGFPKKGTVPMIIAFGTKQDWMSERQSIPADWFTAE